MATNWQTMSTVTAGQVSDHEDWNKVVSNMNLIKAPNSGWYQAEGDEQDYIHLTALDGQAIPGVEFTMFWSGGAFLLVYHFQYRASSAYLPNLYLYNSYNAEVVDLWAFATPGNAAYVEGFDLTLSGCRYIDYGSRPTTPTEVTFKVALSGGTPPAGRVLSYACRPGFLLVELPNR
jgi:hypothetical protein